MSDEAQPKNREAVTQTGIPHDANDLPAVTRDVDQGQIRQFVTRIKTAEHQIGEHIISALQDENTVAVLTAVVVGPDGGQQIVSAALDPNLMEQVQHLLRDAEAQRDDEIPCVGFHCLLRRRKEEEEGESDAPS